MLLSKRYAFIFIHIPKNAGSSIRYALKPYLDKAPVKSRHGIEEQWDDDHGGYFSGKGTILYKYNNFYKFAIVRNPWDRFVSNFWYIKTRNPNANYTKKGFKYFVKCILTRNDFPGSRQQYEWICEPGSDKILIDNVLYYENLYNDFTRLIEVLGIPSVIKLPLINKTLYKPYYDYREYYDNNTRDIIYKISCKDIEMFNYTFDKEKVS